MGARALGGSTVFERLVQNSVPSHEGRRSLVHSMGGRRSPSGTFGAGTILPYCIVVNFQPACEHHVFSCGIAPPHDSFYFHMDPLV